MELGMNGRKSFANALNGSAYVNNFGVVVMAVAVVTVPQTLPELAVALRDALAPRTFPIPSLL